MITYWEILSIHHHVVESQCNTCSLQPIAICWILLPSEDIAEVRLEHSFQAVASEFSVHRQRHKSEDCNGASRQWYLIKQRIMDLKFTPVSYRTPALWDRCPTKDYGYESMYWVKENQILFVINLLDQPNCCSSIVCFLGGCTRLPKTCTSLFHIVGQTDGNATKSVDEDSLIGRWK